MQKHVKVYMSYFDYICQEEIQCEACHSPAVEIHHINGRGKGKDDIKNLMALCRKCHERAHGDIHPMSKEDFRFIHNNYLQGNRKVFLKS